MPNYCSNTLQIKGRSEDVDECLDAIRGEPEKDVSAHDAESGKEPERAVIDFDKIIPRPRSLDVTSGSVGDMGYAAWHGTEIEVLEKLQYPWVKEAGIKTREELQEFLLRRDPAHKIDGDAYAANLKEHGH